MKALVLVALAGCSFAPSGNSGTPGDAPRDTRGSGSAAPDAGSGSAAPPDAFAPPDASTCWTFSPTNFDACALSAAPPDLVVANGTTVLDADTTTLPVQTVVQSDTSHVLVVHVATLAIAAGAILEVTGSRPVILAVDGTAAIDGTLRTSAGANDAALCAGRAGADGVASTLADTGGGGGGGGGGAAQGGDGTDGTDGTHGNGHGAKGAHGAKRDDAMLSPLIAGCGGGAGGTSNGAGTPGVGGSGGGAVQVSAQIAVNVTGSIRAIGTSATGTTQQTGGGGGGGGGAVFLEAPMVALAASAVVCADGGAGSQGGGSSNDGAPGVDSKCIGTAGAKSTPTNQFGGAGGAGGFRMTPAGGNAGNASNGSPGGHGAGGGGAGGGAGWIRLHAVGGAATVPGGAVVTPIATP